MEKERHITNPMIYDIDIDQNDSEESILGEFGENFRQIEREILNSISSWIASKPKSKKFDIYQGHLGYVITKIKSCRFDDLGELQAIVQLCKEKMFSKASGRITFLTGVSGVLTLEAILCVASGEVEEVSNCVSQLVDLVDEAVSGAYPFELLYGSAGFLYSLLLLRTTPTHQTQECGIDDGTIWRVMEYVVAQGG